MPIVIQSIKSQTGRAVKFGSSRVVINDELASETGERTSERTRNRTA